jgi:hypothetical protein
MGTYRYWQHFLALEADFTSTARYVEFSVSNFSTFSIEYAKLLLAIGSEVDVLCKVICERIDSSVNRGNMMTIELALQRTAKLPQRKC